MQGLSKQEVDDALLRDGYNELPSAKPRSMLAIVLSVVREPMFLLLVAGGIIYMLLGDLQEALMLMSFVIVIISITVYQERKTENALQALKDLSSPRALVIRDSQEIRIPGREVVRDDIVIVSEGDRIPADGVLLYTDYLSVDESLLTGESAPVMKIPYDGAETNAKPGGDNRPFVYSGTLVVQGRGVIRMIATGTRTEIGKIGKALQTLTSERTQLEQQIGILVRNLAIIGACLSMVAVVAYGVLRGDWLHGLLAGVALAMSILPEEFPVVLTIFLALGAWRISRKRVLTRRVQAVEALGSATVLCVDKTGTLTQNRMSVGLLWVDGQCYDPLLNNGNPIPECLHSLVEFSILASQRDPFDPMEKAFRQFGDDNLSGTEHIHQSWELLRQYPLTTKMLAMSHVWRSPDKRDYIIAAKGAPEAITELCHVNQTKQDEVSAQVESMALKGLRVLGVAYARFQKASDLPDEQHDFGFEFLGLIGLIDPVRESVPGAIAECYSAGIRVVIITGDYPATAQNIANQINLKNTGEIITGDELDSMDDDELRRRIQKVNIFSRVVPGQKLRLVQALKANGEIVAMTGDGVNDAPALKAADIGIAMGGRGTDVAREAAGLVLLDDDFTSIVSAVRLGRRIFDNLRKAMSYIFAVHIPIAGLSLFPILLGWPLVLLPVHIVLMELIIDPACSMVFEADPEEANVMKRPPRRKEESVFDRSTLVMSILQGAFVLLITLLTFVITFSSTHSEAHARTIAFTALVLANLALIAANLSWTQNIWAVLSERNIALWWVIIGAIAFLLAAMYIPMLRGVFRFSQLSLVELLIGVSIGLCSVGWFESLKAIRQRMIRGHSSQEKRSQV